MVDVGKLTLVVIRDGYSVSATQIRSTRPMAAQILKGKTPEQVLQIVPLLFSVCGRAQGAAASAALQAAQQGKLAASATVERTIVCEAMQEHLWRVMLDWSKLLGLPQQEQRFTAWYSMLRKIGAGETDMPVFLSEFERDGLGMPLAEWRSLDSYHALQIWFSKAHSPMAQLLFKLDELKHDKPAQNSSRLLPAWTAAEAQKACAGKWNAGFSARPEWLGDAAETGAWTYFADNHLLLDVRKQGRSNALIRLLARVMDVVELASGCAAPRLDVTSPAAGEGISVVRTARGLLMHHVLSGGGNCAGICNCGADGMELPSAWRFHELRGLVEMDTGHLQQMANIEAFVA